MEYAVGLVFIIVFIKLYSLSEKVKEKADYDIDRIRKYIHSEVSRQVRQEFELETHKYVSKAVLRPKIVENIVKEINKYQVKK